LCVCNRCESEKLPICVLYERYFCAFVKQRLWLVEEEQLVAGKECTRKVMRTVLANALTTPCAFDDDDGGRGGITYSPLDLLAHEAHDTDVTVLIDSDGSESDRFGTIPTVRDDLVDLVKRRREDNWPGGHTLDTLSSGRRIGFLCSTDATELLADGEALVLDDAAGALCLHLLDALCAAHTSNNLVDGFVETHRLRCGERCEHGTVMIRLREREREGGGEDEILCVHRFVRKTESDRD
jgi:hypothetical protein